MPRTVITSPCGGSNGRLGSSPTSSLDRRRSQAHSLRSRSPMAGERGTRRRVRTYVTRSSAMAPGRPLSAMRRSPSWPARQSDGRRGLSAAGTMAVSLHELARCVLELRVGGFSALRASGDLRGNDQAVVFTDPAASWLSVKLPVTERADERRRRRRRRRAELARRASVAERVNVALEVFVIPPPVSLRVDRDPVAVGAPLENQSPPTHRTNLTGRSLHPQELGLAGYSTSS